MKRIRTLLSSWISNLAVWLETKGLLSEDVIIAMYQKSKRKKTFVKFIQEVRVKKGQRKYFLVIAETSEGEVRFNLGRYQHDNNEGKIVQK